MDNRKNDDAVKKIRSVDTRRFEAEDDNGHMIGSNQANSNERDTKALRQKEDESSYNKLDQRGTQPDAGREDL